mmetsp:Transcript_18871/g.53773  ORF Transcript_18871/g.53773 Transcript_18871/m.53773 type:complete len:210 (+) Transcript_18871:310-939(+)
MPRRIASSRTRRRGEPPSSRRWTASTCRGTAGCRATRPRRCSRDSRTASSPSSRTARAAPRSSRRSMRNEYLKMTCAEPSSASRRNCTSSPTVTRTAACRCPSSRASLTKCVRRRTPRRSRSRSGHSRARCSSCRPRSRPPPLPRQISPRSGTSACRAMIIRCGPSSATGSRLWASADRRTRRRTSCPSWASVSTRACPWRRSRRAPFS